MDRYLIDHFKGKYRVMAHLDLETNDFPRDHTGEIDKDFADFYIKCRNNIEIKHGVGNALWLYVPSKTRGGNILRKMYLDAYGEEWGSKNASKDTKYLDNLIKRVVDGTPVVSAEVLDSEVLIEFKTPDMDWIANYIHPVTSGANISPLSKRNLYKTKYTIPKDDLDKIKLIEEKYPTRVMNIKGVQHTVTDGLFIRNVNKQFEQEMSRQDSFKNSIDALEADKKKVGLQGKEYYHYKGWWDNYLKFCNSTAESTNRG